MTSLEDVMSHVPNMRGMVFAWIGPLCYCLLAAARRSIVDEALARDAKHKLAAVAARLEVCVRAAQSTVWFGASTMHGPNWLRMRSTIQASTRSRSSPVHGVAMVRIPWGLQGGCGQQQIFLWMQDGWAGQ